VDGVNHVVRIRYIESLHLRRERHGCLRRCNCTHGTSQVMEFLLDNPCSNVAGDAAAWMIFTVFRRGHLFRLGLVGDLLEAEL